MTYRRWMIALLILCFAGIALAETELQAEVRLAPKYHAQREVRLAGGERVDLVNSIEAIEIEWAKPAKVWEAIGQATYYGRELGKRPAIILLVTDPVKQAGTVATMRRRCERLGISLYTEPATANAKAPLRKFRRG